MSQNLKILYDYEDANILVENVVNADNQKEKVYKIKGIFSTIGEKNRNGRIYPKQLWETNVKKYQEVIKSGSINRLCEWQHPERTSVDPMEAVAAINSLEISEDGKYVLGEATLLNNPKANQLKSLIDNGIKLSVSSRGSGSVKNGVVDTFDLITYDLVDNPSDYNATMDGFISESVKEYTKDENGRLVEVKKTNEEEPKKDTEEPEKTETEPDNKETKETKEKEKTQEQELKEAFQSFINILRKK